MRTRHTIHAIALFLIPVLCAGCLEVETTTTVHRDGSLLRALVIKGDSAGIYGGHYTVPIDSTWSQHIRQIEERKYELSAEKSFANDKELSSQMRAVPGKTLGYTVSVDESFRWFTSLITYRETLHRFHPVREVPVTDYISQWEIDQFIKHEVLKEPFATAGDSLSLNDAGDRYDEWNNRNVFAAYYRIFVEGVRKLSDASLTVAYVESRKDTLFKAFSKIEGGNVDKQRRVFESLLKKTAVREVYRIQEGEFARLEQDLQFVNDVTANSYTSSVVMPGLILDTNGPTIEGTRVQWKDFTNIAVVQDFEMYATSQVINWWAVVLTGAVVIGGLIVLVLAVIRRRKASAL